MLSKPPFEYSSLAPTFKELEFIYEFLFNRRITSVLEFGCGVTSWAISTAITESQGLRYDKLTYVSIEHFEPCIKSINHHLPHIKMLNTVWTDIPKNLWDLVFIDSSAGYKPPGEDQGIHRKEALVYIEDYIAQNGYVIIHDYHRPQGGHKALRNYLDTSPKFKYVSSLNDRSGVGIYRKI